MSQLTKVFVVLVILSYMCQSIAFAQQANGNAENVEDFLGNASGAGTPVMETVFLNTFWGSVWGIFIGSAYVYISGADARSGISGAITIGALMGYGLGLYLVVNGFSFNQNYLPEWPKPNFGPPTDTQTQVQNEQLTDPLAFWVAPSEDGQSWQAGLQLRF